MIYPVIQRWRFQVVFKYTEALALDLRVFAKHGKRAVVGVDDVKCVARKDPKMASRSILVFTLLQECWSATRVGSCLVVGARGSNLSLFLPKFSLLHDAMVDRRGRELFDTRAWPRITS